MIDESSKMELIKELERVGNILAACQKFGISRATFYRWKETDAQFKKDITRAIRLGKESSVDMVEYALLKGAKDGKIENIKYYLSHNSPRYKPKKSDKFIVSKITPAAGITLEDLIDEQNRLNAEIDKQIES